MRTTGSVENTQRIRLLSTNSKGCGQYSTEDSHKSEKSVQKLSQQSGIKYISCHKILYSVNLRPYRLTLVQELKEADRLLNKIADGALYPILYFKSDEAWFYLCGHFSLQDTRYWFAETFTSCMKNHFTMRKSSMVCVSCGQYFFTRLLIQRYTSEFSKNSMASWPMVSAGTASFNKMEQHVTCLASHWPEFTRLSQINELPAKVCGPHIFPVFVYMQFLCVGLLEGQSLWHKSPLFRWTTGKYSKCHRIHCLYRFSVRCTSAWLLEHKNASLHREHIFNIFCKSKRSRLKKGIKGFFVFLFLYLIHWNMCIATWIKVWWAGFKLLTLYIIIQ